MTKIILTGQQSRDKVEEAIRFVSDRMKMSIGPFGENAIIGRKYQHPIITNDGKDICDAIEFDDETMQAAKELADDAIDRAETDLGNGRKTTTILFSEILSGIMDRTRPKGTLVKTGGSVRDAVAEVEEDTEAAISEILGKASPATDIETVTRVASIATKSDEIGRDIAKMLMEIGHEAFVQVEPSGTSDIRYSSTRGLEISAGLSSHLFRNSGDRFACKSPLVLVTSHDVSSCGQLDAVVRESLSSGRPVILVAGSFSKQVLSELAQNHADEAVTIIPIQPPAFGDVEIFKDYAACLGAKMIDRDARSLSSAEKDDFGTCSACVIDSDKCAFIGISGDASERIAEARKAIEEKASAFDRKKLSDRISRMSGGVGFVHVGGYSEKEKGFAVRRIRDGIRTTKHAMESGVVSGGGFALLEASKSVRNGIVSKAMAVPHAEIWKNAPSVPESTDALDSAKVVAESLRIASRLACLVSTSGMTSVDRREPPKDATDES